MLKSIIQFSIKNKFLVLLFILGIIGFGLYSLVNIPIGAVPDVTNNQVQVISTSRDLSTEDVERFLTYPVELEMANLPGVVEIRSISKFGLSVVTVVFDDNMGAYLPRQLISEKLNDIADKIPEGFGKPFMGPISTGLGEIYQYILDVKPAYQNKYDVSELRTIQDWIVKRQLSGISGVVEVNTWGGFLKTYEVAVNPQKLKAYDISLQGVYTALKENNSISGGGYIEKSEEAYFIRADGLLKSLSDIENIVIGLKNSSPVFIKDLAKVDYGSATRFGAITGNGEGEKVLGQVMMLKGADSKKVINAVIQRVEEIQKSLPEGVFINPFLARNELIGRTTMTIAENLILGFLIVLFVVVLLLGNIRSGLLVASVIPLTLLFALSLMYLFGVDANLMSLGAIDFGIIIDGAVIIVEYLAFLFVSKSQDFAGLSNSQIKEKKDEIVLAGTTKMMNSAAFGQLIIIIVFIPILSLAGVEGKMFKPMAMTFCFALIGAMILCFTYVPVMASLILNPSLKSNRFSASLINGIKNTYRPILEKALKVRYLIIGVVIILLIGTIGIFSKMGGEFVPTLDEGDFVIQPVLKTGMSLAATVKMTTRIEKILKRFPEVKQVVSRIGAAEVPTDPMSMEESDVIITLKDKKEWTSAKSKDALADIFKKSLNDEIPNVEIEFTQPIEMRFNELISGARSDLAIKLFGEDLEVLYRKAEEIEKLISPVSGAADISIEKIDGLPQMTVKYNRQKMARYGINLTQLNDVIQAGFAGKTVGVINEGERQYDLVLKYDAAHRNDIEHLRSALVSLPSGEQLPLQQFADIEYSEGPAKISRDDTKRRVVVGVNVRGRDLQSVVEDIKKLIDDNVKIPSGYYVQYGGQFENLENATKKLLVAVPIALMLIFILLYFAFRSFSETLLVYSAIPLSAIGGVFALYLRDMPFSISAGVGFIALFGIAVLNGIVMIEHFKELKSKGMNERKDFIITGAVDRIRPVLLTAIAAALGFLPMAISTSAGAEIQRPLATVVIGGLISATLLTLIVLPILYDLFGQKKVIISKSMLLIPLFLFSAFKSSSQTTLSLDQAIKVAKEKSYQLKINNLEIDREKALVNSTKQINNFDVYYSYDKNNITNNNQTLHVLGIGHNFKLPAVHRNKKEAQLAEVLTYNQKSKVEASHLEKHIRTQYDHLQYQFAMLELLNSIDTIYHSFYNIAKRKNELGENNILELLNAQQKKEEVIISLEALNAEVEINLKKFRSLLHTENALIEKRAYTKLNVEIPDLVNHPLVEYQKALVYANEKRAKSERTERLPEINLTLFNGFPEFNTIDLYPGIEAGLSIPLFKKQFNAKLEANNIQTELLKVEQEQIEYNINSEKKILLDNISRISNLLERYENTVIETTDNLIVSAQKASELGELDYTQYLLIIGNALNVKIKYLDLLHEHNQIAISLNYLLN